MNTDMKDELPDVSDETLAGIEDRVFRVIAEERGSRSSAAKRRRRVWQTVGVAAALVTVAAVISPAVLQGVSGSGSSVMSEGGAVNEAPVAPDASGGDAAESAEESAPGAESATPGDRGAVTDPLAEQEIVRTASASIVVDDPAQAAEAIVTLASAHGGWVEQLSIGADQSFTGPAETGGSAWVPDEGGYVTVRVPVDRLDPVMEQLDEIGEVASTQVGTENVTAQAVDLRARIDAARASVERLTQLLAEAGSVGDLVQVESTLSERQAELESLERQLESLESQVAMSTLSVSLQRDTPPVDPDPAGFGDGLEAGWNGLLTAVNGTVVAIGFLLPWIAVLAVVWLAVWGIRRALRRQRLRRAEARGPGSS
ncbi:DUF4349 domain-containing protein [Microbacterium sp. JZ31]|uniref:DUF4349 domain-containing protein n=1 Tax=Microbacterium sp. JZ31 TaxID=1906274 RepID=UPI001931DA8E|nr:DUF4349 domain-containing protein [Microbacterium sp. JZ31]